VGLKGTVVSALHCEQVVLVSGRTLGFPLARFALHCLQCLGSLVNCLSWKNNCSPAVKINSAPQSTHFRLLSTNSMAGIPKKGEYDEIDHNSERLARFPVLLSLVQNEGPGRNRFCGDITRHPRNRATYITLPRFLRVNPSGLK
jgi:hypothetical protein